MAKRRCRARRLRPCHIRCGSSRTRFNVAARRNRGSLAANAQCPQKLGVVRVSPLKRSRAAVPDRLLARLRVLRDSRNSCALAVRKNNRLEITEIHRFKTTAIDHSAISPHVRSWREFARLRCRRRKFEATCDAVCLRQCDTTRLQTIARTTVFAEPGRRQPACIAASRAPEWRR
jgi:hypothetical protein